MAVHAQYPTNIITSTDSRNRVRQSSVGENRNFFLLANCEVANLPEFQQLQAAVTNGGLNQCLLFGTAVPTVNPVQSTLTGVMGENLVDLGCRFGGTRKRTRETEDSFTRQRLQQFLNLEDYQQDNASAVFMPTWTDPSCRIALDDNRINSTATSTIIQGDNSSFTSLLLEDISSQLQQQKNEIDVYIRTQGEQLRKIVEEKRQQQLVSLLSAVEKKTSKRLKEKELEIANVNRKNVDLENRIKQLTVEAHLWQKQAKGNEAMVSALRSNLDQAVALSREQSKEGRGDSEDDDAASSHHDNLADAQAQAFKENKELKERKTCRVCRNNEVSILLLPCRHLCLCKDCEIHLNACPICKSTKNASVQVYMA